MKIITTAMCMLFLATMSFAKSKEVGKNRETVRHSMNDKDSVPALSPNADVAAIKKILKQYNSAVEKLDVTGTRDLFLTDSKIYESGGTEGSYVHYMEHHLAPELKGFKSFTFSDYKIDVNVDGNYAFAIETYNYTIIVANDNTEMKRKGVATSVLKKNEGKWKIMISHNSARK